MCRKGTSHADVSAVAVCVGCVICKIERQGCAGDGGGAARGLCRWREGGHMGNGQENQGLLGSRSWAVF